MTEDDAQDWVRQRWGDAGVAALERFAEVVLREAKAQNLISPATFGSIWNRHIVDSAQLSQLAGETPQTWLDVGTGAGFPGMVIATLIPTAQVTLVEPRRRRATFLTEAARELEMSNVTVLASRCQQVSSRPYDVISARAVAALPALLEMTGHLRSSATRYLFPKGRTAAAELATLPTRWQGLFHVEQSITDPTSAILVGTGVS